MVFGSFGTAVAPTKATWSGMGLWESLRPQSLASSFLHDVGVADRGSIFGTAGEPQKLRGRPPFRKARLPELHEQMPIVCSISNPLTLQVSMATSTTSLQTLWRMMCLTSSRRNKYLASSRGCRTFCESFLSEGLPRQNRCSTPAPFGA